MFVKKQDLPKTELYQLLLVDSCAISRSQGVKSPSDLRLELVVLNWLLEFRMTTWSDSTATSHANTCTPTHDFFHFEACIQLRSFQKLWDDSQRAFQYQFRSWLLFFNIILKI